MCVYINEKLSFEGWCILLYVTLVQVASDLRRVVVDVSEVDRERPRLSQPTSILCLERQVVSGLLLAI